MKHYPLGVPMKDLRPTQMTVAFREVERKQAHWRKASAKKRVALLHLHTVRRNGRLTRWHDRMELNPRERFLLRQAA